MKGILGVHKKEQLAQREIKFPMMVNKGIGKDFKNWQGYDEIY